MDFNQWLTLDTFKDFASALVVLRLAVEYTKDGADALAGRIGLNVPTKLYAYLVALLGILIPYQALTGTLTLANIYLDCLNAFVLAIGAGFMQKPKVTIEDAANALGLTLQSEQPQDEPKVKQPIGFGADTNDNT